tara:strand:+ start:383 stop:580 length:198 start_codon:yes stop_codon:yes gene_type:complete
MSLEESDEEVLFSAAQPIQNKQDHNINRFITTPRDRYNRTITEDCSYLIMIRFLSSGLHKLQRSP